MIRGVNPRLTKARCRVCCGGSMLIIISRSRSTARSDHSLNTAVRRAEEKISGCRVTCDDVLVLGDRPESGPAGTAAVGVPEHRRVLAQPGELLVRGAAALVDVGVDEVDLRSHRHRLPATLPQGDDENDNTAIPAQRGSSQPIARAGEQRAPHIC